MYRKILIRVLFIVLILFGLNVIYTKTLFERDLNEKCSEAVDIRTTQQSTDIYYLAESSNFNNREDDSIKSSISEITNLFYPSLKITAINKPASHAGIFKYWLTQLDPHGKSPEAIIVTMNLRSFDAAWINSKLETQLQESMVLTRPYPNLLNRFLLSLQAFDNKTEQQREKDMLNDWKTTNLEFPAPFKYKTVSEWDFAMSQGGYLKPDGSWDSEKIILACHYIKAYAFNIREDNPRIKDFDAIYDWCNRNKVPLYFNLLAENIQYADSLVGKELVFLMRNNRDYLVNRYNKNGCRVIDNLELVGGKEFTDQSWTTEHYGYKGRMIIAKNLAEGLKNRFINDYKKAY